VALAAVKWPSSWIATRTSRPTIAMKKLMQPS
jgi:hypothetical protein